MKSRWTRGSYTTAAGGAANDCDSQTATTSSDSPLPSGRILCKSSATYDGLDRTVATTDAAGGQSKAVYDTLSRKTAQGVLRTGSTWEWTKTAYDADNHPVGECQPNGFTASATDSGACTPAADTADKYGTRVDYDMAGRATTTTSYRETSPTDSTVLSLPTSTSYDADGNAVSTTDPRGAVATTAFDILDRKTDVTTTRTGTTTNTTHYGYDPLGDQTLAAVDLPVGATDATGAVTATATAYDADKRTTDTVTGYTGSLSSNSSTFHSFVAGATASSDGGSNIHTRTVYDQDGNTVMSYQPMAFTIPATGTSPDGRFTVHVAYDTDDQPTQSQTARYDTADPAFTSQAASGSTTQTSECPTGQTGWASTVGVCTTAMSYDAAGNRDKVTLPTSSGSDGRYISYDYTDDNLVAAVHAPDPAHPASGTGGSHFAATTSYRYTVPVGRRCPPTRCRTRPSPPTTTTAPPRKSRRPRTAAAASSASTATTTTAGSSASAIPSRLRVAPTEPPLPPRRPATTPTSTR